MAYPIRFLIDECLSPQLADEISIDDIEITHVNYRGLSETPDHLIARWCVDNDFAVVTNNARDFRAIYSRTPIHPGLVIILPSVGLARQKELLVIAIAAAKTLGNLVNMIVEVNADAQVTLADWPVP
jgi:predicted nuclease of predicted toxin-antitoxin system